MGRRVALSALLVWLCVPAPAWATAGNAVWMNAGSDETGDTGLVSSLVQTNGTVTSVTSQKNTGPRSIQSDVTISTGTARFSTVPANTLADAGRCVSFWWRMSALPATTTVFYNIFQSNGSTLVYNLGMTSSGVLRQPTANNITGKNGSATLSINTWYRISNCYLITSVSTYTFKVYVNGTLDISTTQADGTMTNASSAVPTFGNSGGAVITMWFDDIYIDDRSDQTDTGNVWVTAKHPAALNTNTFDTAVGASPANRWTNVNEVPLSTTNGWRQAATANTQENYTLEGQGAGDVNINGTTIIARRAWIWAKGTAGGAGTPAIMDNGTETAITLTSSPSEFYLVTTSAAYPSNAAGIGMRATNNADDSFLYECGTSIAYQAGGGGGSGNGGRLSTLGVGK